MSEKDLHKEIEKLKTEISALKKRKKYGLVWEEKTEDVVEECKTKLPVLTEVRKRAIHKAPNDPTNIIIEGDNYHALSVLNYTHQGKIDVIYIDPPYNTGAKDWKYNNDYVDDTDVFRHSKWISFMSHRLELSKNLLTNDGVICITIDDNELPRLWLLLDSIFGQANHLGTVAIRNNPKGRMTNKKISLVHEYALFFGKSESSFIKRLPVAPEDKTHNYEQDKDGSWFLSVNLRKQGIDSTAYNRKGKLSDRFFPIFYDPKTKRISTKNKYKIEILPIDQKGEKRIWRRSKDAIDEMFGKGDLWVKEKNNAYQVYYKFRGGLGGEMPKSIWYDSKFSASEYGTQILDSIMGARETFQYPKSPFAVMESILASSDKISATILDFFAGSGTTGHAVMKLNQEDGGKRQFILCTNNENKIAEEVTYPRIKKVIEGYADEKGIPANVRYFKTDFVKKTASRDEQKMKITERCTEMLCLREGVFTEISDEKSYKIFKDDERVLAVYYAVNHKDLPKLQKELEKIAGEKVLYCFTLNAGELDAREFAEWEGIRLEAIPQKILDIYKEIHEY